MTCPPQVWDGVVRRLACELSPVAMSAWIDPIRPRVSDEVLRLACPDAFHRNRIRVRFLPRIETLASTEAGRAIRVELDLYPEDAASSATPGGGQVVEAPTPARTAPHRAPAAESATYGSPTREVPTPPSGPRIALPQQSFASFVVGPENALAREACVAFARGRQPAMSPLCVVAGSGLGKSHLAVAAAADAREHTGARVVYASGEQFTNELLASIRSGRTADFKRRYRRECDLLILEDVHFLRGKRQTQLELLYTLEQLAQRGARVLLTAERMPNEIPDVDPRLASRMASGFCAEIEPPDAELRRAILRAKAAAGGVRLPDAAIERLVAGVTGSVRDLEAVLIQIVASAALLQRPIDLPLVESALRKVLPRLAAAGLTPERIVETVASAFQIAPAALAARSRRRDVLVPRQLAMYLCTRYGTDSHQRIGQLFGRNHTAVANAVRVVERAILERAPLRYKVEALVARLDQLSGRSRS
jgi:chromosomal replication initiator protein